MKGRPKGQCTRRPVEAHSNSGLLGIATRSDKLKDQRARIGSEEADTISGPRGEPVKHELGCHLLEVKLHRLSLGPPPPPRDQGEVLGLEVEESSPRSSEDTGSGATIRQLMRDAQPGQDAIPLSAVDVHRPAKKPGAKRQVEVQGRKPLKDKGVFKPSVLPPGEPLSFRVAKVHVSNRVR